MKKPKGNKPYVICHMATSVDGKIIAKLWPKGLGVSKAYERCHEELKGDAWIIGRTSMEGFSSRKIVALPRADRSRIGKDFVGDLKATRFAIVVDPKGKCRWDGNSITGDHVIEVLTQKVSPAYLAHLREKRVSYIFAGLAKVDLPTVLVKLKKLFGIKRLLLEGGGLINGSFVKAGLIDELSLLVVPVADGSTGTSTLFDVEEGYNRKPASLRLKSVTPLPKGIQWLRYTFER